MPTGSDVVPTGTDGLLACRWSRVDHLPRRGDQVPGDADAVPCNADTVPASRYGMLGNGRPGCDGLPADRDGLPAE